jgi:hypothetical protein
MISTSVLIGSFTARMNPATSQSSPRHFSAHILIGEPMATSPGYALARNPENSPPV